MKVYILIFMYNNIFGLYVIVFYKHLLLISIRIIFHSLPTDDTLERDGQTKHVWTRRRRSHEWCARSRATIRLSVSLQHLVKASRLDVSYIDNEWTILMIQNKIRTDRKRYIEYRQNDENTPPKAILSC